MPIHRFLFEIQIMPVYWPDKLSGLSKNGPQGRQNQQQTTHLWRSLQDSNPGHIQVGGKRSPLRHPCSPLPIRTRSALNPDRKRYRPAYQCQGTIFMSHIKYHARYKFVACDMLTTSLRHELFRVNQTYNLLAIVEYDTKSVVSF